jgi:hypothetical protein
LCISSKGVAHAHAEFQLMTKRSEESGQHKACIKRHNSKNNC